MLAIRLAKIVCVASLALEIALVAFNNLTDYWTNFAFVTKVLSMEEVPPASHIHWRAITSPFVHHASYIAIIIAEIIVAGLTGLGAFSMGRALRAEGEDFHRAKKTAVVGLALGFLLYEGGFIAVGGEWFGMWQLKAVDPVQSAFRVAIAMLGTLIFLTLKDEDLP